MEQVLMLIFLTALVFVALTSFRIDCLPLDIYQRYHRGTETLKAILNESRMTSDWINVFGSTDHSDNLPFIRVKSI